MSKAVTPVLEGSPVAEFKVGFGYEGFEPMPVVAVDERVMVSRHALSPEEVAEIARTGELFIEHPSESGPPIRPLRVRAYRPEYTLRVLVLGLAGGDRAALCHGLEVAENGGTEHDRVDYVAAEAAGLLAARAPLPCRVALKAGMEWLEMGGEECATRDRVEEALALRLRKALDDGEKRVELRSADGAVSLRADVAEMTPRQIRESEATPATG